MAGFDFGFLLGGGIIGGEGGGGLGGGITPAATEQAQLSLAQSLALTGGSLEGLEVFGSPAFLAATDQTLADLERLARTGIEERTEQMFFGLPPPNIPAFIPVPAPPPGAPPIVVVPPPVPAPLPPPPPPIDRNGTDPLDFIPELLLPPPIFPEDPRLDPAIPPGVVDPSPPALAFRVPEDEPPNGGASVFTWEDLNPFLDVIIHATQPKSQQPDPDRRSALWGAALMLILELLRRWNTKRAQDRSKRAAESILAQQQSNLDRYLQGLRDLFARKQGGQPVAFDVGGFMGGVRDVLATPGNLPALLQAFGQGGQGPMLMPRATDFLGMGPSPGVLTAPGGPIAGAGVDVIARALGGGGGNGMFEVSPVTGRMRPRNKLQTLRDGKVYTWLRAEPRGWTIIGAGSGTVSKRRHHHHHHHPR